MIKGGSSFQFGALNYREALLARSLNVPRPGAFRPGAAVFCRQNTNTSVYGAVRCFKRLEARAFAYPVAHPIGASRR